MRIACLGLVMLLLGAGRASAHALGASWSVKDGKLHVEAFFDDDTSARDARVQLLAGEERIVAEGKTDAKGRWSCATPAPGKYRLIVDAGAGHRATEFVVVAETIASATMDKAETPPMKGGVRREEFTRFPWLKVGLGLGAIAVFAIAFIVARRAGAEVPHGK